MNENEICDYYMLYETDRFEMEDGSKRFSRFTLGTYLRGTSGRFAWQNEPAIQFGTMAGQDILAYMFTGQLAVRPLGQTIRQIAVGLDYLSGTADDENDFRTFDPGYHTELDLVSNWRYHSNLTFMIGWSLFQPGEVIHSH